jgi:23S rRNA pseudouridine2605 synthase
VVLAQGLKRQIRLMLYDRGYEVVRLRRIRIGRLTDHKLPPGAWRPLSQKECAQLAGKPAKK